jgi:hypothetical protein
LSRHLDLEIWQRDEDPEAKKYLTPEIQAELEEYSPSELTCRQLLFVATKAV